VKEPSLIDKILGFFGMGKKAAEPKGGRGDGRRAEVTTPRLYVGNLNYDTTDEALAQFFGAAGTVNKAEVVRHGRSERSKGFAFVEMGSVEEAREAVSRFDGTKLDGRDLLVSGAKAEPQKKTASRRERPPREENREPRERSPREEGRERGGRPGRGRSEREGRGQRERRPRRESQSREDRFSVPERKPVERVSTPNLRMENVDASITVEDVEDAFRGVATIATCELDGEAGSVSGVNLVMASIDDAQRSVEVLNGKSYMSRPLRISGRAGPEAESTSGEDEPE